jgi:hypothetical protein
MAPALAATIDALQPLTGFKVAAGAYGVALVAGLGFIQGIDKAEGIDALPGEGHPGYLGVGAFFGTTPVASGGFVGLKYVGPERKIGVMAFGYFGGFAGKPGFIAGAQQLFAKPVANLGTGP